MRRPLVPRAAAATVVLLVALVGMVLRPPQAVPQAAATTTGPLRGVTFYADPAAVPNLTREDRVIGATPQAKWFGDWFTTSRVRAEVDRYVGASAAAAQVPVLTVYAIPHRDCGGYSSGGLGSPAAYAAWVREVARGIGTRQAVVVLEPDAIAGAGCLSSSARQERMAMLSDAVGTLAAGSRTLVYLDAGHARWLSPDAAAAGLRQAGVAKARGFSLNVSNFGRTADEVAYGEQVSGLVGGKAYVVDTSRNGLGPAPQGPLSWCNPSGRALGTPPSGSTSGAHADAYLWVKRPGQSDGSCDRGEPAAGSWFESYAVSLVRMAGR